MIHIKYSVSVTFCADASHLFRPSPYCPKNKPKRRLESTREGFFAIEPCGAHVHTHMHMHLIRELVFLRTIRNMEFSLWIA